MRTSHAFIVEINIAKNTEHDDLYKSSLFLSRITILHTHNYMYSHVKNNTAT